MINRIQIGNRLAAQSFDCNDVDFSPPRASASSRDATKVRASGTNRASSMNSAASMNAAASMSRDANSRLRSIQTSQCQRPSVFSALDQFVKLHCARKTTAVLSLLTFLQEKGLVRECNNKSQTAMPSIQDLPDSRTKYLVQNGDSLESIAATQLGAASLCGLLITINRGAISFVRANGKMIPSIKATQVLVLPSARELEIHKRQYFVSPASVDKQKKQELSQTEVNDLFFASTSFTPEHRLLGHAAEKSAFLSNRAQQSGESQLKTSLEVSISQAGISTPSVQTGPRLDAKISKPRLYQVQAGDTLPSIALKDPLTRAVNAWVLIARLNGMAISVDVLGKPVAKLVSGQFLLMPDEDEVEQFRLVHKLLQIAELTGKKDPDLQYRFEKRTAARAKTFMHKLSNMCRLQLADGQSSFSMKLEIQTGTGMWTTIASYEFVDGKIMRHVFSADGSRSSLDIDLPADISFEMAKQDLCKNWNFYFDAFKRSEGQMFVARAQST